VPAVFWMGFQSGWSSKQVQPLLAFGAVDRILYCLVDVDGNVFAKDDAESYAEVAAEFGLDERQCRQCRYDLVHRYRIVDREWPEKQVRTFEQRSSRAVAPSGHKGINRVS